MTTVEAIRVDAVHVPHPSPESDGTLTWDSTTAVTVTAEAEGMSGLGQRHVLPSHRLSRAPDPSAGHTQHHRVWWLSPRSAVNPA